MKRLHETEHSAVLGLRLPVSTLARIDGAIPRMRELIHEGLRHKVTRSMAARMLLEEAIGARRAENEGVDMGAVAKIKGQDGLAQSSFETIGPDAAKRMLGTSRGNRPLSKMHVESLAREMSAGRWERTGQGISFSADGVLIDGHHRLSAVIVSGATVTMLVTRGLRDAARLVIDTGIKQRGAGDVLHMHYGMSNANVVAALVRTVADVIRGQRGLSVQEIAAVASAAGRHLDWVMSLAGTGNRLLRSVPLGALLIAHPGHEVAVEDFAARFMIGDSAPNSAPRVAREYALSGKIKGTCTTLRVDGVRILLGAIFIHETSPDRSVRFFRRNPAAEDRYRDAADGWLKSAGL